VIVIPTPLDAARIAACLPRKALTTALTTAVSAAAALKAAIALTAATTRAMATALMPPTALMPSIVLMAETVLSAAALALSPAQLAAADPTPQVIRLLSPVTLAAPRVTLADVADLSRLPPALQAELRGIDLAVLPDAAAQQIDRRFIDVRLQLAGYDSTAVRIAGPDTIVVRLGGADIDTDAALERAAAELLARQFGMPVDELRVTLTAPVMEPLLRDPRLTGPARVDIVPRVDAALGRTPLLLRLFVGDRIALTHVATFDVARRQRVLVTTRALRRGDLAAPNICREELRFLTQTVDELTPAHLDGQQLAQPTLAGEILQSRHLMPIPSRQPTETRVPSAPAIQPRDAVRVTARHGSLSVRLQTAEALQSGATGQLIRVRNIDSGRIITGIVVGPGEVEVPLGRDSRPASTAAMGGTTPHAGNTARTAGPAPAENSARAENSSRAESSATPPETPTAPPSAASTLTSASATQPES